MAKADTAYTNIALPAHTDTTYFTDPAGLQAFHLLSHTAPANASEGEGASGGQSLLVDGYHAAEILMAEAPEAFQRLQNEAVPWHASGNEGITITPSRLFPVFDVPSDPQEHMIVRWNNDDRGGKHLKHLLTLNKVPSRKTSNAYLKWRLTRLCLLLQCICSNTILFLLPQVRCGYEY